MTRPSAEYVEAAAAHLWHVVWQYGEDIPVGATARQKVEQVVEALLTLPVEQRMEAMGMEMCEDHAHDARASFVERVDG